MATMYFAKVNVNQNIYDVYKDSNKLEEIFNEMLKKEWQQETVTNVLYNKMTKEPETETYKFICIDKMYDRFYIVGKLIMIFQDDIALYDRKKDDIDSIAQSELSRAVPFYFDLTSEIVAFVPTQKFSRQKFIKYFEQLLNKIYGKPMFNLYIKNNVSDLRRQIKLINKVSEVEITLIPPNSSKDDFVALFPKTGEELEETNGTKFVQKISAPHSNEGLNMDASLFQRIINGVARGFGIIRAQGIDGNGHKKSVSSDKSAPHKKDIKNSCRNSLGEVADYGRAGISEIQAAETQRRIDDVL